MATDLEHDFAAFVDHRDIDALTRVFDATAGRLLLLATHVAGPRATAEDLVQATFVTAMQRCSTWNRRLPVWPWLGAILQNHARMEWRRERRRREVGIDAAAPLALEGSDPAALAASDNAFEAIVGAVDALPVEYRQVLRLRLVHGLAHGEIARALEVPVGTVRARVHRGIERLRQALPTPGCASLLGALAVGEGALLGQVRTEVIAFAETTKAAAVTAVAPSAWIAGVLMMKGKTILTAAACAALLLIGALAWGGFGDGSVAGGLRENVEILTADSREALDLDPARDRAQELQRKALGAEREPAWSLVGVVRTSDKQPIAGARVEVTVAPPNIQSLPDSLREAVAVCESDDEGKFGCELDALRSRSPLFRATSYLFVRATRPGFRGGYQVIRLPMSVDPKEFSVELTLSPADEIVGRVVDAEDVPVAGAVVGFMMSRGSRAWRFSMDEGVTDDEGRFRIHVGPELSSSEPGADAAHIMATDPRHGVGWIPLPTISESRGRREPIEVGVVRLARHGSLRGRVVLGDGSGLGGYPLWAYRIPTEAVADPAKIRRLFFDQKQGRKSVPVSAGQPVWDMVKARTDADGSFRIGGLWRDTVYAIAVMDISMVLSTATARAGAQPLRLVVDRQLLLVDVRDESGGRLPGAGILAEGFDPDLDDLSDRTLPGVPSKRLRVKARFYPGDAQGRRMILSSFGWTWRIGPFDELARPDFIRHDVKAGIHRARVRVTLRPQTAFGGIRFEMVDEAGKPFRPFTVALTSLDGAASKLVESRNLDAGLVPKVAAGRWAVKVHAGKFLERNPMISNVRITARGSHQRTVLVESNKTSVVRIEVPRAGLVGFRLQTDTPPADGKWHGVVVRHESDSRVLPVAYLDEHGRYRTPPAPPVSRQPGEPPPVSRQPGELLVTIRSLPPGRHRFLVEAAGFLPTRCEGIVETDRMVRISVRLRRK